VLIITHTRRLSTHLRYYKEHIQMISKRDLVKVAEDTNFIKYRASWSSAGIGVMSCIFLQALIGRFRQKKGAFFKFNEPCDHPTYRDGDSWTEELGMTIYEFNSARKRISAKVKAKDAPGLSGSLVEFWKDSDNKTWYRINEDVYADFVLDIYRASEGNGESTIRETDNVPIHGNGESTIRESGNINSPNTVDNSHKITHKITPEASASKKGKGKGISSSSFSSLEGGICSEDFPKQGKGIAARWAVPLLAKLSAAGDIDDTALADMAVAHAKRGNVTNEWLLTKIIYQFIGWSFESNKTDAFDYKYIEKRYTGSKGSILLAYDAYNTIFELATGKFIRQATDAKNMESKLVRAVDKLLQFKGIPFEAIAYAVSADLDADEEFWEDKRTVSLDAVLKKIKQVGANGLSH